LLATRVDGAEEGMVAKCGGEGAHGSILKYRDTREEEEKEDDEKRL